MKLLIKLIASFFGLGYFPLAPGTLASFVFLLARRFLWPDRPSLWLEVVLFLLLLFSGTWASQLFSQSVNRNDPRQIVIDEVCGQALAIVALPSSRLNLLLAFILFRALDIIKPFPINRLEKIKGGWGIMADDLAAGLVARLLLGIYLLLF
jgi:phosphatidylglycerophosphatase A